MKFYERVTAYTCFKKSLGLKSPWEFPLVNDRCQGLQYNREASWHDGGELYYCVWPGVIPLFLRLDLAQVTGTHIFQGFEDLLICRGNPRPLCLRFSESQPALSFQNSLGPSTHHLQTCIINLDMLSHAGEPILELFYDYGESPGMPVNDFARFPLTGDPVDQTMFSLPRMPYITGILPPDSLVQDLIRLVCTLSLLAGNEEIITPDVLSKDLQAWEQSRNEAHVKRAIRRGKHGWHIGRYLEQSPHYRRPHPALFWTGHGRKTPIIILRRGTMVHREVIEKVPTGGSKPVY